MTKRMNILAAALVLSLASLIILRYYQNRHIWNLIGELRTSKYDIRQYYASRDLVKIGQPAVGPLIFALKYDTSIDKLNVKQTLSNTGMEELGKDLIYKRKSSYFRRNVVATLKMIKDPRVPEILSKSLDDSDKEVRRNVAMALGEFKDSRFTPELIKALPKNSDCYVRESIIISLGRIGDHQAVTCLLEEAKSVDDIFEKSFIIETLSKMDDPRIPGNLHRYLASPVLMVSEAASNGIERFRYNKKCRMNK